MLRERWLASNTAELAHAALEKCVVRPCRRVRATRPAPACRELWIHIGAHKTATTLVQSILKRRRHVLHRQSVHFESWGYRLGKSLLKTSPLDDSSLAERRRELEQRLGSRPEPVAILSAESFCGNPYEGYRNIAEIAGDLREITRSFHVQIVLAVRRQDDFLSSIYGQSVKEGGAASFEEFVSHGLLEAFDWSRLASVYRQHFGDDRVQVVPYERLVADSGRAVEILFEGCGRPFVCRVPGVGRVNPGLSRKGIELARLCNATLDERERKQFRRFLEQHFCRTPGEDAGILDAATRRLIRQRYGIREENESRGVGAIVAALPDTRCPVGVGLGHCGHTDSKVVNVSW